jgi:TM2 domain-containing membrane protein YozV
MALINCSECDRQISDQAAACPNCGAPGPNPVLVTPTKSRSTTVLLAILLGGIGIHWFYLNRPGLGFLYLIFCWTFIPALIGLIEAVYFLGMSEREFQDACNGIRPFGWLGH